MLDYKAWWSNKDSTNVEFTEDERETFLALKNREYLLTASDNNSVLMGKYLCVRVFHVSVYCSIMRRLL